MGTISLIMIDHKINQEIQIVRTTEEGPEVPDLPRPPRQGEVDRVLKATVAL